MNIRKRGWSLDIQKPAAVYISKYPLTRDEKGLGFCLFCQLVFSWIKLFMFMDILVRNKCTACSLLSRNNQSTRLLDNTACFSFTLTFVRINRLLGSYKETRGTAQGLISCLNQITTRTRILIWWTWRVPSANQNEVSIYWRIIAKRCDEWSDVMNRCINYPTISCQKVGESFRHSNRYVYGNS